MYVFSGNKQSYGNRGHLQFIISVQFIDPQPPSLRVLLHLSLNIYPTLYTPTAQSIPSTPVISEQLYLYVYNTISYVVCRTKGFSRTPMNQTSPIIRNGPLLLVQKYPLRYYSISTHRSLRLNKQHHVVTTTSIFSLPIQ